MHEQNNVSRRSFVKAGFAGAACAAGATAALAGEIAPAWDEEADAVVVGRSIATRSPEKGFIFIDQPKMDAAAQ